MGRCGCGCVGSISERGLVEWAACTTHRSIVDEKQQNIPSIALVYERASVMCWARPIISQRQQIAFINGRWGNINS